MNLSVRLTKKTKFDPKMQKMEKKKKKSIFQNLDLLHFWIPLTIYASDVNPIDPGGFSSYFAFVSLLL